MEEEWYREIQKRAEEEGESAKTFEELKQVRARYLGKDGEITVRFRILKDLPPGERRKEGERLNALKEKLSTFFEEKIKLLLLKKEGKEILDPTLPGRYTYTGGYHPLTFTQNTILSVLKSMGFSIVEGPEVETVAFNFDLLNFPPDHPAREMQDTFFLKRYKDEKGLPLLLRTHTSPVQIRVLTSNPPPVQVAIPGRVFRRDDDPTHSPVFHQIEGLWVDEKVHFGHLKGILTHLIHRVFGKIPVRFRPSYFPFTEPSAEVDMGCVLCNGKGCRVCGESGFLEVLGCGMVHPQVLKNSGVNPKKYQGFAFGMGVERMAMILFQIPDIRLFYSSQIPFLRSFQGDISLLRPYLQKG
jgi:phenylalanyl-tRNA synthetase alpha chain